jgi:4-hydroxy-tetrahydrodipicolinate reductase
MSVGVTLLLKLVEQLGRALDPDWDIEVLEMHHRAKIDAPSGTALALGRAAAAGRGVDLEAVAKRARDGITGARRRGDIGFAVLRGGDVVSDHRLIFASDGERIELAHVATSREIYARGALRAALWAQGRSPGLYSMADVLGLTG